MAAGTVSYTDTRGNKDYLGIIANQIGSRIKQASDMAAEERAYASKQAEKNNTSLEEAGIGRGYFFGRALGSRFGGDKIARTRGRLGAQGPGTDPSRNYKQRFRGGFDYNYSEQINQVTKEVGGAIVPMSSALSVGLRGVESGLSQVSQSISSIGVAMGQLAVAQQDLAKQAMMNGAFMRAFMTYMQRQQSRAGARGEERSIEGGRRRLGGGGGRGPINITPGSGGGGGLAGSGSGGGFTSNIFDTSQTVLKSAGQAKKTISAAKSAVSTGVKAATGTADTGGAIVKAGTSAAKFVPDGARIGQNAAKLLKVRSSALGNLFETAVRGAKTLPGIGSLMAGRQVMMEQSAAGMLGKGGFRSQLKRFITGPDYFADGFVSEYDNYLVDLLGRPGDPKNMHAQTMADMVGDSSLARAGNVIDVPLNSSAADDFARTANAAELQRVAAARMSQADALAHKPAEMATDAIIKEGTKKGLKKGSALARMMVKQFGAAGTKSILKKIPVVAGVAGILFGIQRAMEGDFMGAGLEITSGLLGATGVGAPVGLGIDGYLLARDLGLTPMARGGIVTGPTAALIGEGKAKSGRYQAEKVQPLDEDTFEMEAEAMLKVQMKEKAKLARIYAEGNKEYFDRQGGWQNFGKILGDIFKGLNPMNWRLPNLPNPFAGNGNGSGGGDRPGATAGSDTLDIGSGGGQLQGLSDEDYIQMAKTIAGEAGPGDDQYLVAGAILNRVASSKFPNTVTDVVTAGQGTAHPQFEGYLANANVDDIVKRLKSPEGQARLVASLNRLQGRTDFKGQTQLHNRVAAEDPMFDKLGNFAHYSWQKGPNSVMPSDYVAPNYQQFIKTGNTAKPITPPAGQTDYMKKWMDSIGQAEQQSMQLNQSSLPLSMAPFTVMPNITNVYNQQMASGAGGEDSVGSPFNTLGLDAFALQYSLSAKT